MEPQSPRSTRSSTSSAAPPLLTPVLENGPDDAALSSGSSSHQDDDADDDDDDDRSDITRAVDTKHSPTLPSPNFSFGTCPTVALNATPTSELGTFDYPFIPHAVPPSPPSRRQSLALGMTHRRGSIVGRNSVDSSGSIPSPPPSRRSSTCSTITTLPAAGHRPTILHSASTSIGPAVAPPPRASSIFFPQKQPVTPIPPSLLARRGSLPLAKLFADEAGPSTMRDRYSFSAQGGQGHAWTTTTTQLYRRRESMLSDGTSSQGSSRTFRGDEGGSRRGSLLSSVDLEHLQNAPHVQSRRSSLPFSSPLDPKPLQEVNADGRHTPADSRRIASLGSRLARSSLTSEEAEEEADEGDTGLARVSSTGTTNSTFNGFTDPWANSQRSAVQGQRETAVLSEQATEPLARVAA